MAVAIEKDGSKILEVRVKLKGDLIEKFRRIKASKGIDADAEIIRLLIAEEYNRAFVPH